MKAVGLIMVLSVLGVGGCESPFPPATLVERLRILGIRAEPPETDPFSQVVMTALTADPAGEGRPLECVWAVCLVDIGAVATDIECPGGDSFVFGDDCTTATLSMPELVAWLAERGLDIDDLPDDLPVTELPLYVGYEVAGGAERTRAIKRITVGLELPDEPNTNPALVGLEINQVDITGTQISLPASSEVELRPVADAQSRQTYRREGEDEDRIEDLLFSWFSTGGEFGDRRTILDVDSDGNPLDINRWTLPEEAGQVTLWLVVRDGRYGLDWAEYQIEVEPAQ